MLSVLESRKVWRSRSKSKVLRPIFLGTNRFALTRFCTVRRETPIISAASVRLIISILLSFGILLVTAQNVTPAIEKVRPSAEEGEMIAVSGFPLSRPSLVTNVGWVAAKQQRPRSTTRNLWQRAMVRL